MGHSVRPAGSLVSSGVLPIGSPRTEVPMLDSVIERPARSTDSNHSSERGAVPGGAPGKADLRDRRLLRRPVNDL